jgi:GWxTD domain-containing protein
MSFRSFVVFLVLLTVSTISFAGVSKKELQALPEHYRKWLTQEVNYLITEEEAEAFVRLASDADRDNFINRFWEIRNPDPNSPTNEYRDEIYKRISYANQWFGREMGTPGWMTDMGKVYITLGPPKQRQHLLLSANERPMEVWFYDNSTNNGALPPAFYVVFYQKDATSDFKLYSPYMDGPEKLVSSYQAENGRLQAWRLIDHDLGREVARITLSLVPDEPVDTDQATSSLQSDVLLNTIRTLRDNPWTKRMLEQRRRLLEDVHHRIVLGDEFLYVLTIPLRDEQGHTNVHYLLRLKKPEDFAVAQNSEGKWYYSADVNVRVSTPEKKLIFTQSRTLNHFLSQEELERVKSKVFGYEGVLPLPPGKYNIEFLLTNKIKNTAFRSEKDVIVPEVAANGMRLSEIVPFDDAQTLPSEEAMAHPFQVANVKFIPGIGQDLALVQGETLKFFYQLWAPPVDPKTYGDAKLTVEYAYGRMGMHDTKTISDTLEKTQFNSAGSMINGKKIETTELSPGPYRLSVTVTDPVSHERAAATLSFRVLMQGGTPDSWDISDPTFADATKKGEFDFERAQCYLSGGDVVSGATWLERANQKNPEDEDVRLKLIDSYYSRQGFKQIAALYARTGINSKTDDQSILRIAESFDKLGQMNKAVDVLESAVSLKPQSGPLYLSLAGYYQRLGNTQKATEMEQRGRNLTHAPAQPGS